MATNEYDWVTTAQEYQDRFLQKYYKATNGSWLIDGDDTSVFSYGPGYALSKDSSASFHDSLVKKFRGKGTEIKEPLEKMLSLV